MGITFTLPDVDSRGFPPDVPAVAKAVQPDHSRG